MVNQRWLRLKALHERVFELPLPEARAFVERELADDPELAHELISLLEQKLEGTSFLKFDDAPSRPSIFPPHHRLGDYELLHEIGRGGMGFVYMARHLPLERDVALKVLNPSLSARQDQVDRFRREALRLAKFKNPGIVPIFDVQSIESVHFFAMEYVDGLDLHRELVCLRKQLDPKTCRSTLPAPDSKEYFQVIADLMRQAATALADAHEHQITHRDIKPHNLILGRDGRVRIVDFGIARDESLGRAGESEEVSGTLYYMSPEQTKLTRDRIVDHRTDIYSLGVVMYELLTLRRPFDGATQREVLKAIEARDAKPVRELNARVPRDLAVICQTAMEKDPAERYASARDLAADLERFSRGESIVATPPNFSDLTRRFARRNRLPLGTGAIALVAVSGGIFIRDQFLVDPNHVPARVVFAGSAGEPMPVQLSYQVSDPITEQFGPFIELGPLPIARTTLPVGFLRIRVVYPDGQFKELRQFVRLGLTPLVVEIPGGRTQPVSTADMVTIRGNTFERHVDPNHTLCSLLERRVVVASFLLDAHEVTVRQYRDYLRETGLTPPENWNLFGEDPKYDNRPVVNLSFEEMVAYAEHYGKRLPTHAEWELAARGTADRRTPTGAPLTDALDAAIHGPSLQDSFSNADCLEQWKLYTRDVGISRDDVTPEGVFDMLGNVSEATESAMVDVLGGADNPQVMTNAFWILGGPWYSDSSPAGLDSHAFGSTAEGGSPSRGFRCARSIDH